MTARERLFGAVLYGFCLGVIYISAIYGGSILETAGLMGAFLSSSAPGALVALGLALVVAVPIVLVVMAWRIFRWRVKVPGASSKFAGLLAASAIACFSLSSTCAFRRPFDAVVHAVEEAVTTDDERITQRDGARLLILIHNLGAMLKYSWYSELRAQPGIVYVSVPDTSPDCTHQPLPPLPKGLKYRCVPAETLTRTDGTGWLPVVVDAGKYPYPLQVDPLNDAARGYVVRFAVDGRSGWALDLNMEANDCHHRPSAGGRRCSAGSAPELLPP